MPPTGCAAARRSLGTAERQHCLDFIVEMVQQVGLPVRRPRVSVKATALPSRGPSTIASVLHPVTQGDCLPSVSSSAPVPSAFPKFPPASYQRAPAGNNASGYGPVTLPAAPAFGAEAARSNGGFAEGGTSMRVHFLRGGPSLPWLGPVVREDGPEVAISANGGHHHRTSEPPTVATTGHDVRKSGVLPPLARGFNSYEVTSRSPCETPSDLHCDEDSEANESMQSCELIEEASFHFSPTKVTVVGIGGGLQEPLMCGMGQGDKRDECDMSIAQALDAAGMEFGYTALRLGDLDIAKQWSSDDVEEHALQNEPAQPVVPPLAFVPASEFQLAVSAEAPRSASCIPADGTVRMNEHPGWRSWRLMPSEPSQRREWRIPDPPQDPFQT
mmetsp:Transcript_65320/g.156143  ORF Transcript_65320/g.156143 Transcript_65320/m.156143 type:complete len:386 (-) Transcript_65320:200-1357(-)